MNAPSMQSEPNTPSLIYLGEKLPQGTPGSSARLADGIKLAPRASNNLFAPAKNLVNLFATVSSKLYTTTTRQFTRHAKPLNCRNRNNDVLMVESHD